MIQCFHCDQTNEPTWRFCWSCGTVLARIDAPVGPVVQAIPENEPAAVRMSFRHGGPPTLAMHARVALEDYEGAPPTLRDAVVKVSPVGTLHLTWPELEQGFARATLRLAFDDGPRTDPWTILAKRETLMTVTVERAEKRLSVEPATLLFHPSRPHRRVVIRNDGRVAVRLDRLVLPYGYDPVDIQIPTVLRPGHSIEGAVVRRPYARDDADPARVEFEGETVAVPLQTLPSPPPEFMPPYTVGVDFGTSHTSIFVRPLGASSGTPLIVHGKARFETVIYCATREPSTWRFGEDAIRQFRSDKGRVEGRLVRELKSRLQEPDRPLFPDWPEVTSRKVLAWYLERLLHEVILRYFESNAPELLDRPVLEFVLSLPVLDNGMQLELQREVTMQAAMDAGFGIYGQVRPALEPVCAACFLLLGQQRARFGAGDRILVFDSGGGTTDLCLGVVSPEGGRYTLTHISAGSASLDQQGTQFGGARVTNRLGKIVHQRYLEAASGGDPVKLAVSRIEGEEEGSPAFEHFLEHPQPDPFGPEQVRPWRDKFPDFYRLVDEAKIKQAQTPPGEPSPRIRIVEPTDRTTAGIDLHSGAVDDVTREAMQRIGPSIRDWISKQSIRPNRVVAVGGNSLIPSVRERLRELVGVPLVDLNEDQRNLAVAAGTVFVREVDPDALPYGLRVRFDALGTDSIEFVEGSRPQAAGTPVTIRMNQDNRVGVQVSAVLEGHELPLFHRELVNDTGEIRNVTLSVRVERTTLAVDHNLNDFGQNWIELEI